MHALEFLKFPHEHPYIECIYKYIELHILYSFWFGKNFLCCKAFLINHLWPVFFTIVAKCVCE